MLITIVLRIIVPNAECHRAECLCVKSLCGGCLYAKSLYAEYLSAECFYLYVDCPYPKCLYAEYLYADCLYAQFSKLSFLALNSKNLDVPTPAFVLSKVRNCY